MKTTYVAAGMAMLFAAGAAAQIFPKNKKEEIYDGPKELLEGKLRHALSEQEYQDHLWQLRTETMPSEAAIRRNVAESESGPFLSRRSVRASETMVRRSEAFGGGKYSHEVSGLPTLADRRAALRQSETEYPGKARDEAILAAVYRHFFDYRKHGFGKDSTVYFLGLGPHKSDVPPSFLAALQADPVLKKDGIALRPISRSLEVTGDAIRDRDTGVYGSVFRIDDVGLEKDGEVRVVATFSERDGFWFTRELSLREGKAGWEVTSDGDYAFR